MANELGDYRIALKAAYDRADAEFRAALEEGKKRDASEGGYAWASGSLLALLGKAYAEIETLKFGMARKLAEDASHAEA